MLLHRILDCFFFSLLFPAEQGSADSRTEQEISLDGKLVSRQCPNQVTSLPRKESNFTKAGEERLNVLVQRMLNSSQFLKMPPPLALDNSTDQYLNRSVHNFLRVL